ncbi:MAG: hypothetical protein KTR31_37225, partial [Myxococcales bacterium]|nr:hypothetical protein [Myxococcales bacterium]
HQVVAALRHELFHHPHPDLPSLVQRAELHAAKAPSGSAGPYEPVICDTIRVGGRAVHTITTVMRFDKPSDVTMAELRVELMFPADEAAERVFRELVEALGS